MKTIIVLFMTWEICFVIANRGKLHSKERNNGNQIAKSYNSFENSRLINTSAVQHNQGLKNKKNDFSECGKTNKTVFNIVGGSNSSLGDWPWMVAFAYKTENRSFQFLCGGSLISKEWVLTAAHCAYDRKEKELVVRLGDIYVNETVNNGATSIDILIDNITVHPYYHPRPLVNDIALLHLKNPVQFTNHIYPICLSSHPEQINDEYYNNKRPVTLGWGKVEYGGKSSSILQEVKVNVVNLTECKQLYANKMGLNLDKRIICAGGLGKDACQGDSGGPLMFPNSTSARYYLGGVTSAGHRCGEKHPGIYTKVAVFMKWINDVTGEMF